MKDLVKEVFGNDATVKAISSETVLLVTTVPRHMSQKSFENFEKNAERLADKVKGIPVVVVRDDVTVDAIVNPAKEISPKRLSEQQQQEQVDDDYCERDSNATNPTGGGDYFT